MMNDQSKAAVTALISGRIDSNNSQETEEAVRAAIKGHEGAPLVLDASGLTYISSAGLRMLLKLRKDHPELSILNVSSEVYEILDMTGFTEMMNVQKAFRTISIDGCEQIGRGANGGVYRFDNENVVKVYNDPEALDEIKNEREMAKLALVLGLPTAISYDVVKVGESYGSVFELLNARSFSKIIANEPARFDWCVNEYASLLKKIHSTSAPEGRLPDIKRTVLSWAEFLKPYLPEAEGEKLVSLIAAVPESCHLIHGDYHTKNIMLQNDEVLLIDMDTLAVGDPIFELGSVFNAFIGFHELHPENIVKFQGFDSETGRRFFYRALEKYLGTGCKAKLREVADKARIVGYTRLVRRSIRRGGLESESGRAEIEHWKNALIGLINETDELTFSPDELTITAERVNLDEVLTFIDDRIGSLVPSEKARMQLNVAAEEIFVNICDYAYSPGRGKALMRISTEAGSRLVTVVFEDGGTPFDPLKKQDPDLTLSANEREPGGLGIFLTKQLTDGVSYEYRDGRNILTFVKKV